MNDIRFVWDGSKASLNKRKRGISFEEAQTVFYDESAIEYFDPDHSEDRFIMLGFSFKLRMLVVCYCTRRGNNVRIISARKATRREAENYRKG